MNKNITKISGLVFLGFVITLKLYLNTYEILTVHCLRKYFEKGSRSADYRSLKYIDISKNI
jgi:hypothetical protein